MSPSIREWITHLSDDYLIDWANRGLFRRGSKLAEKHIDISIEIDQKSISGSLDRHTQCITGTGLKFVSCSCPAVGTCYHMLAFVILLRRQFKKMPAALSNSLPEQESTNCPWLIDDPDELDKALGRASVRRAQKMLIQAVPVHLEENDIELIATIEEKQIHTVRIPRVGGIQTAICSCKKERCSHRALAVLKAGEQKGLFCLDELLEETISQKQQQTIDQIKSWLKILAIQGISGVSRPQIEQGEALATLATQADMPKIARQVTGITFWLSSEIQRAAHARPASLRYFLARLSAHLKALEKSPLPQPMLYLAGAHQRNYRLIRSQQLLGIGAEAWKTRNEYCGFTLFLYSPDQHIWYRHSQARPVSFATENDWDPVDKFNMLHWVDGLLYRKIAGSKIHVIKGWISHDYRLSGREGTQIKRLSPLQDKKELPVYREFALLAKEYSTFMTHALFADDPFMPAIIESCRIDTSKYDPYGQIWNQTVYDSKGLPVHLRLTAEQNGRTTINAIESMKLGGKIKYWIFGLLSNDKGELMLRPISLSKKTPQHWHHFSIPDAAVTKKKQSPST